MLLEKLLKEQQAQVDLLKDPYTEECVRCIHSELQNLITKVEPGYIIPIGDFRFNLYALKPMLYLAQTIYVEDLGSIVDHISSQDIFAEELYIVGVFTAEKGVVKTRLEIRYLLSKEEIALLTSLGNVQRNTIIHTGIVCKN